MSQIETEYDVCTSMTCGECKHTMQNLFWMGFKNKMCLNSNCPKNNNDRDYCHCEHMHTLHEGTFGVCLVDDCLCDSWYYMCDEKVWKVWDDWLKNQNTKSNLRSSEDNS